MKFCDYCDEIIRLMTPPQDVDEFDETITVFFCSELCRKTYKYELSEYERVKLLDASVQKSPAQK